VWGNWFIVTLVTHSSGVSRGIHHKCKHPLNLTRLYVSGWVVSSLVYCLRSHDIFGWHILLGLCNSMWLHDKLFSTLAYPLFVWLLCVWFSLLAMIINLLMRELPMVIRVMEVPLLSLCWDRSAFRVYFRAMTHVISTL